MDVDENEDALRRSITRVPCKLTHCAFRVDAVQPLPKSESPEAIKDNPQDTVEEKKQTDITDFIWGQSMGLSAKTTMKIAKLGAKLPTKFVYGFIF